METLQSSQPTEVTTDSVSNQNNNTLMESMDNLVNPENDNDEEEDSDFQKNQQECDASQNPHEHSDLQISNGTNNHSESPIQGHGKDDHNILPDTPLSQIEGVQENAEEGSNPPPPLEEQEENHDMVESRNCHVNNDEDEDDDDKSKHGYVGEEGTNGNNDNQEKSETPLMGQGTESNDALQQDDTNVPLENTDESLLQNSLEPLPTQPQTQQSLIVDNMEQQEEMGKDTANEDSAKEDTPRATIAQISPTTSTTSPPNTSSTTTTAATSAATTTTTNPGTLMDESILVELQASLQHQMTIRAEVEDKLRQQAVEIESYKKKLQEYSNMEDQVQELNAKLTQSIAEKTAVEQEVMKLREGRDDLERREAVLSNRLNDAKMKEANVSNVAGRLEVENEELKKELSSSREELKTVVAQKQKLENSMDKLKKKCVERVKMSEAALVEERNLNEERKKKMKVFVETKAEELRSVKSTADELRAELKETSEALESVRGKLERMTQQYENATMKNRELTREINRMKKNSEQLHQLGGSLEMELQKSAQETEEHKNKRLTAKHELMTILRKLEAEQAVSGKLRDSVKFTFTPKALSQQQLLQEGLEDFESELLKLSRRLGKPLPPSSSYGGLLLNEGVGDAENTLGQTDSDEHANVDHAAEKKKMNSRSEWDAARLLSSLEHETQQVSKGIMKFTNAVERLHILLDTSGEKTCVNTLNEIFGVLASARAGDVRPIASSSATVTASTIGQIASFEDEDGSFSGSPVNKKRSGERYGLVGPES